MACGAGGDPQPTPDLATIDRAAVGFSPGAAIRNEPDDAQVADFAAMAATGATWVRLDIDWSVIEPEPGRYDWESTDRLIDHAIDHDLKVLGLLTYTPKWARPDDTSDKSPPIDDGDFAHFAALAAERYRPLGVRNWEVWNEPNSHLFWEPGPDPARYGRLLTATVDSIRAVQPDANIISGGLAPGLDEPDGSSLSPITFLRSLIEFRALGDVDAVAVHPYSFPARPLDPESARWNTFLIVPELHRMLVESQAGPSSIWITEYGAPTGTTARSLSETDQATLIIDALGAAADWPWTGPTFLYAFRDFRDEPDDLEWNYGIVNNDRSPKLANDRLSAALAE